MYTHLQSTGFFLNNHYFYTSLLNFFNVLLDPILVCPLAPLISLFSDYAIEHGI